MSWISAVVAVAFWVLLLSSGTLIMLSRNRAAQHLLIAVVGATALTAAAVAFLSSEVAAYAYLTVDGMLLGIALYYLLKLDCYWPIWFAGFHSIAVASELSRFAFPGPVPEMYANLAGFWSVPALIAMALGVNLDRTTQEPDLRNNA